MSTWVGTPFQWLAHHVICDETTTHTTVGNRTRSSSAIAIQSDHFLRIPATTTAIHVQHSPLRCIHTTTAHTGYYCSCTTPHAAAIQLPYSQANIANASLVASSIDDAVDPLEPLLALFIDSLSRSCTLSFQIIASSSTTSTCYCSPRKQENFANHEHSF